MGDLDFLGMEMTGKETDRKMTGDFALWEMGSYCWVEMQVVGIGQD